MCADGERGADFLIERAEDERHGVNTGGRQQREAADRPMPSVEHLQRQQVEEAGRKAVLMPGDISQEQHYQQIVQRALQEFGHLNILVNNAARQILFPSIDQIPSEEWDYIFRTNIYAQFYLTKAA
jgi:NAD(P)-dependent dehydrogenase (short-subunit alcohol dehydrogenase family)